MKTNIFLMIITMLIVLGALFISAGCQKDETLKTDPANIILGKWEMVETGNYPNMKPIENPSGYIEFLPDSLLKRYNYESGEYIYEIYWIDSLLQEGSIKFRYNFTDNNNKIELEFYQVAGTFNNLIYKRIK